MDQLKPWEIEDQDQSSVMPWQMEDDSALDMGADPGEQGSYAGNLLRTTAGQGFGLGLGDELEGLINSGLSQFSDDPKTYQQARGVARAKIKQFQSQNPKVAITSEIVGGLIPTVIAVMSGIGAPAGAANTARLGTLGKRAFDSAKIGSVAGVGYSESEGITGIAGDATKGAVASVAGGEILRGAARGAGSLYDKGVNAIRNKYGDGYAGKVQEYLNDLMKRTGKSLDETLEDIRNGAVMSEDEQLLASLRAIASKGGDASGDIKTAAKIRAEQTRGSAKEALDEALVPGQSGQNVRRVLKSTDDELKADQAGQYESIYSQAKAIPKRLSDRIVGMMRINPQVRQMFVEDFDSARLANPRYQRLFQMVKNEDGTETLELLRPITLADAEGFRRNLKETASMIFESPNKRNTPGFNYLAAEKAVRGDIDKFSPDLAAVRGSFADREAVEAAIKLGRKMSSKGSDEVAVAMDTLTSPEQLAGFRAGMHNVIDKRFSDRGGNWSAQAGGLDVSNRTPNALMREVLPADQADDVIKGLGRYGMANQVNQKVKPAGGSITQFAEAAGNELDAVGAAGVGVQLARGDLPGAVLALMNKVRPKDLGLNDKQLQSVVKVLFSEDPEFVRRALADNTTVGELNKRIIRIAQNMEMGGQNIARRQAPGILEDF
jgi:hypothetical protein